MTTILVTGKDGRKTSYNVPEVGQTVTLNGTRRVKITVKLTRVDLSTVYTESVILTGYRIYQNGRMSDRVLSYPAHITHITWETG